ncbi:sensor histidine kinase [Pedosphaera parvula]|uniref:histidine kinase n=1 Tax=Pedosphaera parvula (strain Ellin514) TaxID=320771 RepID=B9XLZ0_PEDPL|nr:ATP-binding protein [Pedosphaera parvula]EEF59118.1 integral membrane sensor signal transduction histidine kinase [Pedosphaera parvula Ellin514]
MKKPNNSLFGSRLETIARIAALAVISFGAIALLSWFLLPQNASTGTPLPPQIRANTALAFLLSGACLWLTANKNKNQIRASRYACHFLATVVTLFGSVTLLEFFGQWDFRIDQFLTRDNLAGWAPGRPAFFTALLFLIFGISFLLLDRRVGKRIYPSDTLIIIGMLISILALLGHLCNFPAYYMATFIHPGGRLTLLVALGFTILGTGMLCARPQRGLMAIVTSKTAGGVLARRLLLAPILIPAVLGLLPLLGINRRFLNGDVVWLFAFADLLALTLAIWWNASIVFHIDLKRLAAEQKMLALNDDLEKRVTERTLQLEAANRDLQQEITERRQAELEIQRLNAELEKRVSERTAQLEASNKELESFCYSVSHDLRAPLRSIDGFAHALQEEAGPTLNATSRDHLHIVRSATKHMGRLIDDLLQLSRLNTSQMRLQPVDLSQVAQRIVSDLQRSQPGRSVEFIKPSNLIVQGDERLLSIALQNLLSNAWKFTAKASAPRIELGMEHNNGETLCFVRDNGAGFEMAFAGKLFRAFQRLHSTQEFPGHGIGLATVQRILNRHGGRVWAQSAPNQGATFYFILPNS